MEVARAMNWEDTQGQLDSLLRIPAAFRVPIQTALQGGFSLFHLMATLSSSGPLEVLQQLERDFPLHAKQTPVLAAHECIVQCDPEGASRVLLAASVEDSAATTATTVEEEEETDVNEDSNFMATALQSVQKIAPLGALRGAVALWTWQNRLQPLFWRCCRLVDVAGKTPSALTTKRSLQMTLSDLRQFCVVVREWMGIIVESWNEAPVSGAADPIGRLPFPNQLHQSVRMAQEEWAEKSASTLDSVRQSLLLARALLAVFKYQLRGVHITCVLPVDSSLREQIHPGGATRPANLDLHRHELVLRLMPVNLSLATQFAKELGMNMISIRQNAASILINQ